MSNEDVNGAERSCIDHNHSNSNDQTVLFQNRKRSVQNPNEYESYNRTPKRNRTETPVHGVEPDRQQLKVGQNKPTSSKLPTASTTTYFNTGNQVQKRSNESSNRRQRESPRQTFPPFRIILQDVNSYPSTELNIIREINKYSKLNLTYGRYAKTADDQMCFLLYASTTAQFEHLMCEANWPAMMCNSKYKLNLPSKIPSSYSIVVRNVPTQWNPQTFGEELKQQYPTIVRVVRLFITGGRPLSKVRVDFSSFNELSAILKSKRLVLDDDNTAFAVEPYLPPTRILRCYNCQAYDDHVAAHCPNKESPICFRCGQHHVYNSNCDNPIKCIHCQGDHMAGNPNCPVKLNKRFEKNQRLKAPDGTPPISTTNQQRKEPWSFNTNQHLFGIDTVKNIDSSITLDKINNQKIDIINMFDTINDTMLQIKQKQVELQGKIESIDKKLENYQYDMSQVKTCIYDILCPLVKEISNQIQLKAKGVSKQSISPLYEKLTEFMSTNMITKNVDNLTDVTIDTLMLKQSTRKLNQSLIHES
jgi:hypothetical protein